MSRKLSVVIPTLQKDPKTLNKLVSTLVDDEAVKEILIIDNSLKGFPFDNKKVCVITPKENLFVNPSWNLGVKEAKYEYICLVNDDIKIPPKFCSKVLEKISDDYGIIGIDEKNVIQTKDENNNIILDINSVELEPSKEVSFQKITYRPSGFGIMIFFKKENFVEIPQDLKVFYGDDWIIYQADKNKKINATCTGQDIYHIGSLSSKRFENMLSYEKRKYYRKIVPNYKKLLYCYKDSRRWVLFILGLMVFINKKGLQ